MRRKSSARLRPRARASVVLPTPGHVLDQHVPAREQRRQQQVDGARLVRGRRAPTFARSFDSDEAADVVHRVVELLLSRFRAPGALPVAATRSRRRRLQLRLAVERQHQHSFRSRRRSRCRARPGASTGTVGDDEVAVASPAPRRSRTARQVPTSLQPASQRHGAHARGLLHDGEVDRDVGQRLVVRLRARRARSARRPRRAPPATRRASARSRDGRKTKMPAFQRCRPEVASSRAFSASGFSTKREDRVRPRTST